MSDIKPFISVVIPSYNQSFYIDDAISSILSQSYENVEIIVIDGGSEDDTVKKLQAWGDRITWISENDDGQTDALIKGFSRASGEWLTWLNSDDFQTDHALHRVAAAINKNPHAEVVLGNGHYARQDGTFLRPYPRVDVGPDVDMRQEFFLKGFVAQPSVYFKRSAYMDVGGVNPERHFCMDYDLWVRLADRGSVFVGLDHDISGNRWYQDTKTATQTLQLYAEAVATQVEMYGKVSPYFVQAISNHLFAIFHGHFQTTRNHLFLRWLWFKAVWTVLNHRTPGYCLKGLVKETISKSDPVIGDTLRYRDLVAGGCKRLGKKIGR